MMFLVVMRSDWSGLQDKSIESDMSFLPFLHVNDELKRVRCFTFKSDSPAGSTGGEKFSTISADSNHFGLNLIANRFTRTTGNDTPILN